MMRELADNILDIAQNSISARASLVEIDITVDHSRDVVSLRFADDGCGMSAEMAQAVCDPFTTTRKTRKVGLGLPLLKMTAQATGGDFAIESEIGKGTTVTVSFGLSHIDPPPRGDVPGALFTLVLMNPQTDFLFIYDYDGKNFTFDTRMVKEAVAPIPLDTPEISALIKDCLYQEITELHGGLFS